MKNYSVRMIREQMENIPQFPIPKGFAMRNYRPDEGAIWDADSASGRTVLRR